ALRATLLYERARELRVAETFDGRHVFAVDLRDRRQTRIDDRAADQHRAGAALAFAAAFFGTGQAEICAQHIQQALAARLDADLAAIQSEPNHRIAPSTRSGESGSSATSVPMAFETAAAIAGAGPSIGSSPMPLAPPAGPCGNGFSTSTVSIIGTSVLVGMM